MNKPPIPKDKFDIQAVENLKNYTLEELDPILMDLLEWVQDINWPVAIPMSAFLKGIKRPLIPHIKKVFAGNDFIWIYWILTFVINDWHRDLILELKDDLLVVSRVNSKGEDTEFRALELLIRNKVGEYDEIKKLVAYRRSILVNSLSEIKSIESALNQWAATNTKP